MLTAIYQSVEGQRKALQLQTQELSYRFELEANGIVIASFTMGLPPQQFSRTAKLRASVDKTYGGSAVELGRADNEVITMRGTYGGYRLHGWFGGKQQTGMDAYKSFRDKILLFTQRRQTVLFNKKMIPLTAIKFYDLYASETKYVHIQNFVIERNSARPYYWDYNISMLTIDKPEMPIWGLDSLLKLVQDASEFVNGIGDTFDEFGAFVTSNVDKVNQLVDDSLAIADRAFDMADTAIATVTQVSDKVVQLTDKILSAPTQFIARLDTIISASQDLADSVTAIRDAWDAVGNGEYGRVISSQWTDMIAHAQGMTIMSQIERKRVADMSGASPSIIPTQGSKLQNPAPVSRNVTEPPAGFGRTSVVETHSMTDGETLEDLALQYYGDRAYTVVIADYNGLSTTHVEVGQIIKIPLLETDTAKYTNLVLDRNLDKFGKDIILGEGGTLRASSTGDIDILSGIECMIQNLQARWQFVIGELRSDLSYGMDVGVIGRKQSAEVLALLQVKILEALSYEQRIKDVTSIIYVYTDTGLQIEVSATMQDDIEIKVPLTVKGG